MNPRACAHCGGTTIFQNAAVELVSDYTRLRIDSGLCLEPDAWLDKKPVKTDVTRCDVCCDCGAVTFKVSDPQGFLRALQGAKPAR